MKRIICLIFSVIFLLTGCSGIIDDEKETVGFGANDDDDEDVIIDAGKDDEFLAAWLSYLELSPPDDNTDEESYKKYICEILENLSKIKINNLFVQVRPFADAIYPSELFPSSAYVCKKQGDDLPFDFLKVIVECADKYDISVHAWINPYRIQKDYAPEKLCEENIAKKWLESKSENVIQAEGGLYFNPASAQAARLIIDGVREILENYDVSGIHIDDYFYPSTDESIDKKQFEKYKKSGGKMNLSDWRRENVSSLVAGIYSAVKSFGKDKIFSISPGGDIEKDRDVYFADVERWCGEQGFCDMIIPQIYYGFENEKLPFEKCCQKWKKIACSNVKICAGLALYKTGKEDAYAGEGKNEWKENSDIISRQAQYLRKCDYDGFCLYSAGFVKFNENSQGKEIQNLCNVI